MWFIRNSYKWYSENSQIIRFSNTKFVKELIWDLVWMQEKKSEPVTVQLYFFPSSLVFLIVVEWF